MKKRKIIFNKKKNKKIMSADQTIENFLKPNQLLF